MFNLNDELNEFYRDHVRLGKTRRDELATFRDNNLTRLQTAMGKNDFPLWTDWQNQGGYQMKTLNQARDNAYDLDVALIFEEGNLPQSPKKARERVRDMFCETSGQFKEPPEARQNAVTVWYQTGQHLDFAIYRYSTHPIYSHQIIQHASGDQWVERDPDAVTNWFSTAVDSKSPSSLLGATVEAQQLRKIVRFVKFFNRSRVGGHMPGGMITTTLVVECYRPDALRDDVALFNTLEVLTSRLQEYTGVASPIPGAANLTDKEKHEAEVANMRDGLWDLMPKLRVLNAYDCSPAAARNAWRQFFNHEFWNAENFRNVKSEASSSLLMAATAAPATALSFPNAARGFSKPAGFA